MDIRLDFFLLKTEAFLDLLIDPSLRPSKYGPSMIYRRPACYQVDATPY